MQYVSVQACLRLTKQPVCWHGPFADSISLLKVGESDKEMAGPSGTNPFAAIIDEAEGTDKIEQLQSHENEEIYEKAVSILETFFDVEDGEVENLAPAVDANNTYAFGAGAPAASGGAFNFSTMAQ